MIKLHRKAKRETSRPEVLPSFSWERWNRSALEASMALGKFAKWATNYLNKSSSSQVNPEVSRNEIEESVWYIARHDTPRPPTLRTVTIDLSDENESAEDSIRDNGEFTSEWCSPWKIARFSTGKPDSLMTSIELGTTIASRNKIEMPRIKSRLIANLIQRGFATNCVKTAWNCNRPNSWKWNMIDSVRIDYECD
jgi:hypothetical protein